MVIVCCPYEIQIRKFFERCMELINGSPALKQMLVSSTKSPFQISFNNDSHIKGFSAGGGNSGSAENVRGQRADAILIDESDYISDEAFDSIMALAGERPGITIFLSSTPTGARKRFWQACTNPKMGFKEFHFPSMCNPDWGVQMEEEFRAQLSDSGYVHEILAEFGEQETGVFNKDKVDAAMEIDCYTYSPLNTSQRRKVQQNNLIVQDYIVPDGYQGTYRPNIWRTVGVDWDKYGASSSILILDYDMQYHKFRVTRRIEVPKAEYSYDAAVQLIIELNKIYRPSFIYVDRGSGEFTITPSRITVAKNCEIISGQNRWRLNC